MIYGYIRISTDKQTVQNQKFEIMEFAAKNDFVIDQWIEETVSGTKNPENRLLGKLLKNAQKDDLIICSELSRLGRSLFMIMSILNQLMEQGTRVWTVKEGYKLGDDIQSKVLAFAFGLSAEIERTLISQRTKEALAARRNAGIKLGRPKGSGKPMLYDCKNHIKILKKCGMNESQIARAFGVSRTAVRNVSSS